MPEGFAASVKKQGQTFIITNDDEPLPVDLVDPEDPTDPEEPVVPEDPTEPEVPVAPEAPTVPEDSPRLPQTGQTMWLAGLLAAGGLLMLFVGLVERKRHHGKHEA